MTNNVNALGLKLDPLGCRGHLQRYHANPIVLFEHTPLVLGKTLELSITSDKIIAEYEYAEGPGFEEQANIARLDRAGYLRSASIGFVPIKQKMIGDIMHIEEWELVEWSKVTVPVDAFAVGSN